MLKRSSLRVLLALAFCLTFFRLVMAQPISGSIESGLQELAQMIVNKTTQNDADVVAVLPFPNSDGTCSVLSNYLADEIIQSLFSIAGAKLRIIERSQVQALLREIKYGEGGLLDPVTTQKLGSLRGVKALVLGTVTVIGDHIRINARLVSTTNGQTVSVAAIGIARNGEIDGLLQQPIPNGNGLCGRSASGDTNNENPDFGSAGAPDVIGGKLSATYEGVSFTVQNVSRSQDKKVVSVVLALTDTLKSPINALMVYSKPTILDDAANLGELSLLNGVQSCQWNISVDQCKNISQSWTTLSPGMPTMLRLRFAASDSAIEGNSVSIAASMLVAPVDTTDRSKILSKSQITLSFANVPITGKERLARRNLAISEQSQQTLFLIAFSCYHYQSQTK